MQPKIITIGRQYGSGGREIGEKLAAKLGIPCHDKRIIERVAKEKGYCEEVLEQFDETHTRSLLFSLVMNSYGYKPLQAQVREAQVEIIRELAKQPCVIIGRAADSILDDMDCVNIFIHADNESRVQRIMQCRGIGDAEARDALVTTDKERAQFYRHYSDKKWGDAANYDLTVNSAKLGVDGTVDLILSYLNLRAR